MTMRRDKKCSICGKAFAMDWARDNCEKRCKEKKIALQKKKRFV